MTDQMVNPGQTSEGTNSLLTNLRGWKSGGAGDSRKTVTFGDSSAVRSEPKWTVVALILMGALWWAATKAWGFPAEFLAANEGLRDVDLLAACDRDESCGSGAYSQALGPRTFPSPRDTWSAMVELWRNGFANETIWGHTWASLRRVGLGMFWGVIIGVPVGFAMGLSSRLRGFFDAPVELFRPIPPLALLPLFILMFGIGDPPAIRLLFFAALWIMVIAARSGVRTANLSKVRAAYSLGASKWQVLTRVLLPNALPEIFTGLRVALGVCWGTLVAAELVGTRVGLGSMIFSARPFFRLDIMLAGVIIIALLGVLMDVLMRFLEARLIPWRGKG